VPYANVGQAFYARLKTAVAGTSAGDRVFPTMPTQDQPGDYVVYQKISGGGEIVLGGRSKLQEYSFRVNIYADDEAAAEAIITAMSDETNGLPGFVDRANGVQGILPSSDQDADVLDDGTRIPGQTYSIFFEG
jgi:hypothetical protein